jgi:RHS repeat-associated protein
MSYYPYGEGVAGTNAVQFATYNRDSYTGLDYADQRFYASSYGRFNTPDPNMASGGPGDPGSFNRYSYTRGDPVNRYDPGGTNDCSPGVLACTTVTEFLPPNLYFGPGAPGGGWGTSAYFNGAITGAISSTEASVAALEADVTDVSAPGANGVASYFLALNAARAAQSGVAKLKDSQPCDQVLSNLGMTFQDLQAAVAFESFSDGTTSTTTMASLFMNSSPANQALGAAQYGGQTVQSYFGGAGSGAAVVACAGCNLIFLNNNQFGGASNPTNEAILMHEALHNFTGLTDYQIQSTLSGTPFNLQMGVSSNNITALMESKCVF